MEVTYTNISVCGVCVCDVVEAHATAMKTFAVKMFYYINFLFSLRELLRYPRESVCVCVCLSLSLCVCVCVYLNMRQDKCRNQLQVSTAMLSFSKQCKSPLAAAVTCPLSSQANN